MDIEKVFDKVNHKSLLQTIKKHFPKQIHHLLKSYLSNRSIYLCSKNKGPIFWSKRHQGRDTAGKRLRYRLYLADIPTTTKTKILTFTDNTAVLVRYTIPETAVTLLQEHTTKIEIWIQDKPIKANPSKCYRITFTLKNQKPPDIHGMHIIQARPAKYLRHNLDAQLTW